MIYWNHSSEKHNTGVLFILRDWQPYTGLCETGFIVRQNRRTFTAVEKWHKIQLAKVVEGERQMHCLGKMYCVLCKHARSLQDCPRTNSLFSNKCCVLTLKCCGLWRWLTQLSEKWEENDEQAGRPHAVRMLSECRGWGRYPLSEQDLPSSSFWLWGCSISWRVAPTCEQSRRGPSSCDSVVAWKAWVPLGNAGRGVFLPPYYTCARHWATILMSVCKPETWASSLKQKCSGAQRGVLELPTVFQRGKA